MTDSNLDVVSALKQPFPVPPNNIGRHGRWILPAAAGAALLALAAAVPQLAAEADDPLPAAADVQVPDAPSVEAGLPVHRVTTARIDPREKRAAANEAPDTASLEQDDPRWAREVMQPNPRELPRRQAEPAEFEKPTSIGAIAGDRAMRAVENDGPALSRIEEDRSIVSSDEPLDPIQTASLPASGGGDAEVAAIDPEPEAIEEPGETAARTTSRVTTHVNLRAGPGDEHKVLTVVPADAVVGVIGCDSWCEISYQGRTGFVFNRFVNAAGAKAAPKPATTEATAAKPVKKAIDASTAETAAGQHNAFGLTCGFSRQCATYGPSTAAAPPAN